MQRELDPNGTIKDVLDWVDDDPERARMAYEGEKAKLRWTPPQAPRKSLLSVLEGLMEVPEEEDEIEEQSEEQSPLGEVLDPNPPGGRSSGYDELKTLNGRTFYVCDECGHSFVTVKRVEDHIARHERARSRMA